MIKKKIKGVEEGTYLNTFYSAGDSRPDWDRLAPNFWIRDGHELHRDSAHCSWPRVVVVLTTMYTSSIDSFANFDQAIKGLFITKSLDFVS